MGKTKAKIRQTENETSDTFATPSQLAQIQSFQAHSKRLIREINRPASLLMTAMLISPLMNLLFSGWFYPLTALYDSLFPQELLLLLRQIMNSESNKRLALFATIKARFADLRLDSTFNPENQPLALGDILDKLEMSKTYETEVLAAKHNLVDMLNDFMASLGEKPALTQISEEKINSRSLKDWLNFTEDQAKQALSTRKQAEMMTSTEFAALRAKAYPRSVLFVKLLGAIAIQRYGIEPMVARLFPYGILQSKPPVLEASTIFAHQAQHDIEDLSQHVTHLDFIAKRNNNIARLLLFFITTLIVRFKDSLVDDEENSPELVIFLAGLMMTAVFDLKKEITLQVEKWQFEKLFANQQALLEKILGKHAYQLTSINTGNLESSHFILVFEKMKNILSPDKMTRILKDTLASHLLQTNKRSNNALVIPANFNLKNAQTICHSFNNNIEQEKIVITLKRQIKKILENCFMDSTSFLYMPNMAKNSTTQGTIEFFLPLCAKDYLRQLTEMFAQNTIEIEKNDDTFNVVMTTCSYADEAKLQTLCTALKQARLDEIARQQAANDAEQPKDMFDQEIKTDSPRPEHRKTKPEKTFAQKSSVPAMPVAPPLPQQRIIRWSRVDYDSAREENDVHPLEIGRFRNYKTLMESKQFVRNGLSKNDIPDDWYKAIVEHVKHPALVAESGKQGFKYWRERLRNQNGQEVTTSMKLKLLGVFGKGDVRAYTTAETSPTGEVLHTVVAINFYAHKKRGH